MEIEIENPQSCINQCLLSLTDTIHELDKCSGTINTQIMKQYKQYTLEFLNKFIIQEFGDTEDSLQTLLILEKRLDYGSKEHLKA